MSDIRTARRGEIILDAIMAKQSLVLRTIGGGRAGEVAAGRYLDSDDVTADGIIEEASRRTLEAARGRPVLAIQDTTEINFSGRAARRTGLGPTNSDAAPGFFCHPTLLVDIEDEAVLGLARAEIWTRADDGVKSMPHRHKRATHDKESARWLRCDRRDRGPRRGDEPPRGGGGPGRRYVHAFFGVPAGRRHDRPCPARSRHHGEGAAVLACPGQARHGRAEGRRGGSRAPARPRRRGQNSLASVASGKVEIVRPKNANAGMRDATEKTLALGYIEVREVEPPAGVPALCWRLLTMLPIATRQDVAEVLRLYRLRWRIEQMFRQLKSDGLDLEATQVTAAARLLKLAALGLVAAARAMQLVDARDGSPRPATDAIDAAMLPAVAAISATLEGATARQKNPHAQSSLAFVAWVAARLGGWTGYYKPPGPKTMAAGWRRLTERLEGFALAATLHRSGSG